MRGVAVAGILLAAVSLAGCGYEPPPPPPDTFKIACDEIAGKVMESSTTREISGPISGTVSTWVTDSKGQSSYASGYAYGTGYGTVTITERLCVDDGGHIKDMELK